jgi:hypothetical protein
MEGAMGWGDLICFAVLLASLAWLWRVLRQLAAAAREAADE